jgi:hypothetical protein
LLYTIVLFCNYLIYMLKIYIFTMRGEGQAMAKMKDRCLEIFISLLLLNFNHYIFTANSQQITAVNAESVYPDF